MAMKISVSLHTGEKELASTFELPVRGEDLVGAVKEKVAAAQLIAFPDHALRYNGVDLDVNKSLSEQGVEAGAKVEFVLSATENSVAQQLAELLRARDLTCDELGLLYCYKHGVSTNQALKTVGVDQKLADFLTARKEFIVEGGKVSVKRDDTSLQPVSVASQLKEILQAHGASMAVPTLCTQFLQKFHTSVATAVHMRPLDFLLQEDAFTVVDGRVSLSEWPREKPRTAPAEKTRAKSPAARAKSPAPKPVKTVQLDQNEQLYTDLHAKISSRSFNSRVAHALTTLKETVEAECFLSIESVVKGGSVGKGTALTGCEDAELVFMVRGLPADGHAKWLPPMLRAVQATLQERLPDMTFSLLDEAVRAESKGFFVDLRFAPVLGSYVETVQALGKLGPYARKPFEPSFAEQRVQFISKQPGHVKVTMRLIKWWRDQQSFSCNLTRPSDYLLELLCIYVAQQCGKVTQAQMVANCMALLAKFDGIRVCWSNFYDASDVWAPLLRQKPLLMDPVNPFTNVADPQDFDPREVQILAAKTHFFW